MSPSIRKKKNCQRNVGGWSTNHVEEQVWWFSTHGNQQSDYEQLDRLLVLFMFLEEHDKKRKTDLPSVNSKFSNVLEIYSEL